MSSQMKRYIGEVWEGPQHRNFCPHEAGVHPPPGVDVFTHTQAL